MVSESDTYRAYMEDPDDPDLTCEFEGLSDDEIEELKCEYVTFSPKVACVCSDLTLAL